MPGYAPLLEQIVTRVARGCSAELSYGGEAMQQRDDSRSGTHRQAVLPTYELGLEIHREFSRGTSSAYTGAYTHVVPSNVAQMTFSVPWNWACRWMWWARPRSRT